MVSEHRSGYDGSPLSADSLPSSSAGSKSSALWRSAIEKIKRTLYFFKGVFGFVRIRLHPDVLLVSKLAQERNLVTTRSVFDLTNERVTKNCPMSSSK